MNNLSAWPILQQQYFNKSGFVLNKIYLIYFIIAVEGAGRRHSFILLKFINRTLNFERVGH